MVSFNQEVAGFNAEELARLNVKEMAVLIRGLDALVTEFRRPEFAVQNFTILDVTIRDTADHDSPDLVDLRQAVNYGFEIHNQSDQVMTFRVIGSTSNLGSVGTLGDPYLVGTNATDFVAVPDRLWLPFVGARVTFPTAPTDGTVTLVMVRREHRWVRSA